MITWEEVLKLREAIPPRYPRGSPENKKRQGPGARFAAARRRYEREHGEPWGPSKEAKHEN